MLMTPISAAETIYQESLCALMAHSIRGVTNYFLRHDIELDLVIKADHLGIVERAFPSKGSTSVLMTHCIRVKRQNGVDKVSKVKATIFINKDANRHLARICIAHEIYHLLLELQAYSKSKNHTWETVPITKQVEDDCNQFAWELCRQHESFNRDENQKESHVYFPAGVFDTPLKTHTTHNSMEWPAGIMLDPDNPFHSGNKTVPLV